MSKPTKVPGISKPPASADAETQRYLASLSEAVEIRLGRRGDPIDRAITLRELIDSGLALRLKSAPFDPNNPFPGFSPNPILDTNIPPAPTNFAGVPAYSQVILSWDYPRYNNHSFTEIYGYDSDSIGDAQLIGVSTGRVYIDPVGSGVSRYYWARHVSTSSVAGPWNNGSGTLVATALNKDALLAELIASIPAVAFATGIEPVSVVNSLPAVSGYSGPLIVFLTTDGKLYRFVSGAWTAAVQTVDLTGTISGLQIASDAVTNSKIAVDAIQGDVIAASAITATKIASDAVTNSKIAVDAIQGDVIAASAITATKIAASAVTSAKLAADAVTNSKIAVDAIQGDVIAANAITEVKITDDAISAAKIAANAVTAGKISAGAVIATKIATGAITAEKVLAGAISADKIAADAVTAVKIAAGAVVASKIAANAVTASEIAAGTITATEIATGAITAAKIVAGAITATEIATNAITSAKITANAVTASEIAAGTITATEIAVGTITATEIAAGTITSAKIVAGAITATEIAAGAVTATEIATGAVTADAITAGAITAGAISAGAVNATNIIADGVIIGSHIAADAVTSATIEAGSIGAAEIAAGSIIGNKIAANTISASKLVLDLNILTESASGELILQTSSPSNGYGVKVENLSYDATGVQAMSVNSSHIDTAQQTATYTVFTSSQPFYTGTSTFYSGDFGGSVTLTHTLPEILSLTISAAKLKETGIYFINFGASPTGSISNSSSTSESMVVLNIERKLPSSSTWSQYGSFTSQVSLNGSMPLSFRNGYVNPSLNSSYDHRLKLYGHIKGFTSNVTKGFQQRYIQVFRIHRQT